MPYNVYPIDRCAASAKHTAWLNGRRCIGFQDATKGDWSRKSTCDISDNCALSGACGRITTAKRIYGASRVTSSLFNNVLSSTTVSTERQKNPNLLYNQSSDRSLKSIMTSGMHTPRNKMGMTPGGSSAAGNGVDIKHNSYDRYLARKKGSAINHTNQPIWHKDKQSIATNNQTFNIFNRCKNGNCIN